MTFLRSYADDMPLQDWLTKQIFPMEAKLQPDDIYWLSKLGNHGIPDQRYYLLL